MDLGLRSPMLDFFKRGEVAKDVRLLAASGALAPRALDQIGLLAMLTDDGDDEIRATAEATLAAIPGESLAAFLGRSDVPEGLRDFFRARGVEPLPGGDVSDEPLVDVDAAAAVAEGTEAEEPDNQSIQQKLALMGVAERMKAAMKGSKSERAILIRDPNKLVSSSVLSSPKLTESEVENFAKLANVSEEILRTIGQNRGWTKNYGVIAALTKNPKTPLAVSMRFVQRLSDRDLKMVALDRNLHEPLKLMVRKRIAEGQEKEMIRMLSADDKVAEIKRLYYQTTRVTIKQDFAKAIDLLKTMSTEEERERVAVYMDGLSQMRSDWARQGKWTPKTKKEKGKTNRDRKRTT